MVPANEDLFVVVGVADALVSSGGCVGCRRVAAAFAKRALVPRRSDCFHRLLAVIAYCLELSLSLLMALRLAEP